MFIGIDLINYNILLNISLMSTITYPYPLENGTIVNIEIPEEQYKEWFDEFAGFTKLIKKLENDIILKQQRIEQLIVEKYHAGRMMFHPPMHVVPPIIGNEANRNFNIIGGGGGPHYSRNTNSEENPIDSEENKNLETNEIESNENPESQVNKVDIDKDGISLPDNGTVRLNGEIVNWIRRTPSSGSFGFIKCDSEGFNDNLWFSLYLDGKKNFSNIPVGYRFDKFSKVSFDIAKNPMKDGYMAINVSTIQV